MLHNFVASTHISFIPNFINIRLNLTEKKQLSKSRRTTNDNASPSQPISSADLSSQQS